MYNCLRYCQRLFSPLTLEAVDQVIRHNRRLYSHERLSRKIFHSVSSAFKEGRIITKEKVSNFDELVTYISNLHRIQLDQISDLFSTIKDETLTEKQVLLLFECCSNSIPNDKNINKHDLCETVLKKYETSGQFSERVYKSYISICTENKQCVDADSLISALDNKITNNLLKLILKNVCECGNVEKALKVLAEMKKRGYNLDEEIFNYLILVHTIDGGHKSGLNIIKTMQLSKVKESNDTLFFIIKGLAQNKDLNEFKEALEKYKISYKEEQVLSLLESLGSSGNYTWAKLITKLVDKSTLSKHFVTELEKLCINLVHNAKYDAAFQIYKMFIDANVENYGNCILREMLFCSAPIEKIVELAEDLNNTSWNKFALQSVTESALRNEMFTVALDLFRHFSILKPHYFWPILIDAHLREGEIGLLKIVQTASDMGVKFDCESFDTFIYPRCDLKDPQRVWTMFQEVGYTIRALLTPMLIALLKNKYTSLANQLCDKYPEVQLEPERIMEQLSYTWLITTDHHSCVTLLQKISESQTDVLPGKFLIDVLEKMRNITRMRYFVDLVKEFKRKDLLISSTVAEEISVLIMGDYYLPDKVEEIQVAVNDIIDFSKISNVDVFLHPRNMSSEQLELHLIELKNKGMETRSVLRKLIQKHSGQGNVERVKELKEELDTKGYTSSPGMRSAVLHSRVQEKNLEEAMKVYEEMMRDNPCFKTDNFKIIDLASLLVENDKFDRAVDVLQRHPIQKEFAAFGKTMQRNIVNLLKAAKDIEQQKVLFEILIDRGYCEPTNIVLGALMQFHIEKDTLENTVEVYVKFCQEYGKTPMQVVLLSEVLEAGNDELLQKVLDGSALVHGNTGARSALVSAMCEKGLTKQVVTVLQGISVNPTKDIERRSERWVQTGNMKALQTILAASRELPPKLLPVHKIQLAIMRLYGKRNDCDGALAFWKQLVDEEDHIDTDVDNEFCELLNRCKFNSPENLTMKYKIK